MASVGEELQAEREARGLSIREVEETLHVPAHYLEAMENGESSMVADEFYVVPFVRQYAGFLGLDPARTVARYIAEAARRQRRSPERYTSPPAVPAAWWVGIALLACAVVGGLWYLLVG